MGRVVSPSRRRDPVSGMVVVTPGNAIHTVLKLLGFKGAAARDRQGGSLATQALLAAGASHAGRRLSVGGMVAARRVVGVVGG